MVAAPRIVCTNKMQARHLTGLQSIQPILYDGLKHRAALWRIERAKSSELFVLKSVSCLKYRMRTTT